MSPTRTGAVDAWLDAARRVAQEGRARLQAAGERLRAVREDAGRDLKIGADRSLHAFLCARLRAETGLPILSEEQPSAERIVGAGPQWIVDPLDGSVNYSRGLPLACIAIGLWEDGRPRAGVVQDVVREECFSGLVGRGAWLNGRPIRVSAQPRRRDAILCTGYPAAEDRSRPAVEAFMRQLQQYRRVRLLGSAALSLAYVACARADAYFERGIALWDVAAGMALVTAAGGCVWASRARGHRLTVLAGPAGLLRREAAGHRLERLRAAGSGMRRGARRALEEAACPA
jgi:myo-inositol-1(or 4)-monophosphatase